jgi:hypothetical protein
MPVATVRVPPLIVILPAEECRLTNMWHIPCHNGPVAVAPDGVQTGEDSVSTGPTKPSNADDHDIALRVVTIVTGMTSRLPHRGMFIRKNGDMVMNLDEDDDHVRMATAHLTDVEYIKSMLAVLAFNVKKFSIFTGQLYDFTLGDTVLTDIDGNGYVFLKISSVI